MSPPLILSPVLTSDLEAIYRFCLSVDSDRPINRLLFPNGASDLSVASYAAQDREGMLHPESRFRQVMVKELYTDEIVGTALWFFFTENEVVGASKEKDGVKAGWWAGEAPGDVNGKALMALAEERKQKREELMKGKPHAYLASLSRSPDHQAATLQLLEWGLSLADSHYLPTYVDASTTEQVVYFAHNFRETVTLNFNLQPWGTPHVETHTCMIRPAPSLPPPDTICIAPFLTNADFADFPAIEDAAFNDDSPLSALMFPSPPPQPSSAPLPVAADKDTNALIALRVADFIASAATEPGSRHVKAFLPATGQILGFAHWYLYATPDTLHSHPQVRYPPNGHSRLGEHFFSSLLLIQESYLRGQAYAFLHLLVVLPEWQGRGAGTGLVRWGLRLADEGGLRAWVDASPASLGLYKKLGWVEVGRLVVELEEWGGKVGEKEVTVNLIREPRVAKKGDLHS